MSSPKLPIVSPDTWRAMRACGFWIRLPRVHMTDLSAGRIPLCALDADMVVMKTAFDGSITLPTTGDSTGWAYVQTASQIGFESANGDNTVAFVLSGPAGDGPHQNDLTGNNGTFNGGALDGQEYSIPPWSGSLSVAWARENAAAAGTPYATVERGGWIADSPYTIVEAIVESGHFWTITANGTSGNVKPNFAGHIGGTVSDNGMTWTDGGAVPTDGDFQVYVQVAVPIDPR